MNLVQLPFPKAEVSIRCECSETEPHVQFRDVNGASIFTLSLTTPDDEGGIGRYKIEYHPLVVLSKCECDQVHVR